MGKGNGTKMPKDCSSGHKQRLPKTGEAPKPKHRPPRMK